MVLHTVVYIYNFYQAIVTKAGIAYGSSRHVIAFQTSNLLIVPHDSIKTVLLTNFCIVYNVEY